MTKRLVSTEPQEHGWPMQVVFTENDDATRADIVIDVGGRHYHGWGRARRNPNDPDIPRIGEEVATARALTRLAQQLLATAAEEIEGFEGHSVSLHV
ncbi:MAG TPA: DUF1876 domain-containing protein [Acidimicrobiia bacterium]|nr:DUF1876 domain-containing protein [Acidimicrobiia bacterium]